MTHNPRAQRRFSTTEAPYFSPFSLPDYSEDPFMQKLWSVFSTPLRFSTISRLASSSAGSPESPSLQVPVLFLKDSFTREPGIKVQHANFQASKVVDYGATVRATILSCDSNYSSPSATIPDNGRYCWYSGTCRQCLSAALACTSQLGPIPTTPQDPLQGRDGHFTPQARRLKV